MLKLLDVEILAFLLFSYLLKQKDKKAFVKAVYPSHLLINQWGDLFAPLYFLGLKQALYIQQTPE